MCFRYQVPIKLAWALTTHKAQGLTLDYAVVDFKGGWSTEGMHYVALSRVRSLAGLQVKNFNAHQVKASALVTRFYRAGMDPVKANIEPWDADEPEIEKALFDFDARV